MPTYPSPSSVPGPGLNLIESQVLGVAAASVTFSAIPQTYKSLVIKGTARGDAVALAVALGIKINGVALSGANYQYSNWGPGGFWTGGGKSISGSGYNVWNLTTATAPADVWTQFTGEIVGYASTSHQKTFEGRTTDFRDPGTLWPIISSMIYHSNDAVTSIVIEPSSGSIIAGSQFDLYGVS